jgi:hypothetical protein
MTIRVHALEDSSYYKPDGDCYAPQVVLTGSIHELNTGTLPFDAGWLVDVMDRFKDSHRTISGWHAHYGDACRVAERYFRIFWDMDVSIIETHGHSQGDWGHSFVFATPEWLEMTGAPGVRESDHNDFCAWLWGDVYEVFNDDPEDLNPKCPGGDITWPGTLPNGEPCSFIIGAVTEDCPMFVYGMDQAMEYGEITFPTHHTYTTYDY